VSGIRDSLLINGVPVAAASAEIDLTTAEQLRMILSAWERGGSLVLLRPQPPVARMLELIGADQVITIRGISTATP
jgi:hypothetical protein